MGEILDAKKGKDGYRFHSRSPHTTHLRVQFPRVDKNISVKMKAISRCEK